MYDSRTYKPRLPGTHRYITRADRFDPWERVRTRTPAAQEAIAEGLIAYLDADMPAKVTSRDIERAHGKALAINNEIDQLEREQIEAEAWAWHGAQPEDQPDDRPDTFEPNMYTHDDSWMPVRTVGECREVFGGTDFMVLHTNVVRRR